MSWQCADLGDAVTAQSALVDIEQRFIDRFGPDPASCGAAVFTRYQQIGGLHCHVLAYFSPLTDPVASAFDATPCPRPHPADLELLVGDQRALQEDAY